MSRIFVPTSSLSRPQYIVDVFKDLTESAKIACFVAEPPIVHSDGWVGYDDAWCVEAALFLEIQYLWVTLNEV